MVVHISKQQAIAIVTDCARKYQAELMGQQLLFIAQNQQNEVKAIEVSFEKRHFLHLTGMKVCKLNANRFFDRCIQHRLLPGDFDFAQDGTTQLKLQVLPYVMKRNLAANMVADFDGIQPMLYTEKLIGNVKACVGFVSAGNIGYVPNTLLNVDMRELAHNRSKILAVYRKHRQAEKYSELVYQAKHTDLSQIQLPGNYQYLVEMIAPESGLSLQP